MCGVFLCPADGLDCISHQSAEAHADGYGDAIQLTVNELVGFQNDVPAGDLLQGEALVDADDLVAGQLGGFHQLCAKGQQQLSLLALALVLHLAHGKDLG